MNNKKYTFEEILKYVNENSECELLSKEYINNHTNLVFRCKCGEIFKTTFIRFKRGKQKCNNCIKKIINTNKRFSYDKIKNYIELESNSGCKLLSNIYINVDSKIEIMCSCGNVFETTFYKFSKRNQRKCRLCSGRRKWLYDDVKFHIENNSNCLLLSTQYKKYNDKLKLQCLCGEHFNISLEMFNRGKRKCNKCSKLYRSSFQEVKAFILANNYNLLSDVYINMHQILTIQCDKGHIYYNSFNNFKRGARCPHCCGNIKLEGEYVYKKFLEKNLIPCFLPSDYKNNSSPLPFLCKNHIEKGIQYKSYANLKLSQECKYCAIEKLSKENHYNWKGGITPLHQTLRETISQWKKDSLKKDNYKCVISNKNNNLEIHHLYNFSKILYIAINELNLPIYKEINNYSIDELNCLKEKVNELHYQYGLGVCLTKELHKEFHHLYGNKNNTPEQFEEFKQIKLKQLNIAS